VLCCALPSLPSAESISLDHPNPNPAGSKGRDDKPSAGPLSDDIHPPPTILNLDLVRMLDRHLSRAPATAAAAEDARPGGGCALSRAGTDERLGSFAVGGGAGERAGSCGADKALGTAAAAEGAATSSKGVGGGSFSEAAAGGGGPPCAAGQHEGGSGSGRLPRGSRASGGVLDIGPTRTMHLQMTPMVSCGLVWHGDPGRWV
jgi:hypothetical protein